MVTILIFDRQSLCQASISIRLSLLLPESTQVADCATEAELARHITDNPGATLFLGQISLRSEAMQLARQLSCPVVWIADPKDEYLPLLAQPAIRGIMFRTAKAADLAECIAALRERRMWIQQLDNPDDATSSQQEKWGLLTQKQRQLTALLLEGMQCKEIAAQRGTTCQVIKNSVVLIYAKLGVQNRYDLLKALLEFPPTCERASIKPRARKR
ncbi:MAG: LuxR C-terminal-related transcriptional regulator [Candidatus Korobacteraceae bacterium]